METLNTWLINVTYICIILVVLCGWLFYLRAHYAKAVVGKVLGEFITPEGNGYSKLLPVAEGMITMPPKGKKKGKSYAVADIATYQVDYPSVPRLLSIISTKVKKAVFDEESWEPLTNRKGRLLLSPVRLYNLHNEKFSQTGMEQSREEFEGTRKKSSGTNINWTLIAIIVGIIVACVAAFLMIQNLDVIKTGMGIQ